MTDGDPRIRAVLSRLDELDEVPLDQHPAVVEEIHRALQDVLASPPVSPPGARGG